MTRLWVLPTASLGTGDAYEVRKVDPVSRRVLRLLRTVGQPSEFPEGRGSPARAVVNDGEADGAVSDVLDVERHLGAGFTPQISAVLSSIPTAAAHSGVIVCQE